MKYESQQSNEVSTSTSATHPSPTIGFIPKGLMKLTYGVIENFNKKQQIIYLDVKNMSKKDVFNLSKELSDYNIGCIVIPNTTGSYLSIRPMKCADDYSTDYRILIYSPKDIEVELPQDITSMAKEGFQLEKFAYVDENGVYAAKFIK